ncbi:MAG TPA: carbamoyl phosphate synthase small subunit, partial [Spirochaetia bacterium]|nr:carbamoyl phosphate synthase small subunit [Spirochaetia bacterium]
MKGILLLEDGLELSGTLFGSCGFSGGEIVFNTSMTGYQEILSDPSYYGQLIVMTFPLIGIYGINPDDFESDSPRAAGFIVKEIAPAASNFTAEYSLDAFFRKHNMTGISGIDTRFLTRHIRSRGAMRAVYGPEKTRRDLIEKIKKLPQMQGADLVQYAGCKSRYVYAEAPEGSLKIGVIDCGIKTNILRLLAQDGIKVICYPPRFAIEEISNDNIHGLLLSNGPGDPEPLNYIYEPV